jgi:hypothetical protein
VPPGIVNPKGIDKGEVPEESKEETSSPERYSHEETKEVECPHCGKMHKADVCMTEKAELSDGKGNRSTTSHGDDSVLPGDKECKEVNKPKFSEEKAGSGGAIKKGKEVKKAEPPMAKPPSGKNMGTHVPVSKPKAPAPAETKVPAGPGMKKDSLAEWASGTGKVPAAPTGIAPTGPGTKPQLPKKSVKKGDYGISETGKVATGAPPAPAVAAKPKFGAADLAAGKAKLSAAGIKPGGVKAPGLASPKAAGVTPVVKKSEDLEKAYIPGPTHKIHGGAPAVAGPGPEELDAIKDTEPLPKGARPGIFGRIANKFKKPVEAKVAVVGKPQK